MHDPMPPDLARLGDQLAAATTRSAHKERRRRRMAVTAAVTALAFVAVAPGAVQRGESPVRLATATAVGYTPSGCDMPRGATFAAVRPCASPGTRDVAPDRRLAEN
jgi:hypothetical protein